MKKEIIFILSLLFCVTAGTKVSEAQILKGFGKKLEKKIEQRIERKADRQVDKALDKADKKTDEPIDNVLNRPKNSKTDKKEKTKSANKQVSFDVVAEKPDEALLLIGGNCQDLGWFKEGAVLEYEAFDDKGRLEGTNRMEVENLSTKGSATIATVKASMKTPHFGDIEYTANYVCDGDRFYMDMGAMLKAMMENNPEVAKQDKSIQDQLKNIEMEFSDSFASFPKKMHPGMVLDDFEFSFKTKAGTAEMSFQALVTDRQVVAREVITTKAGRFDCLKIRSVTNGSMKVMGVNQSIPQSVDYIWIAPKVGMIKQETHSKGAVSNSMQLKSFKL